MAEPTATDARWWLGNSAEVTERGGALRFVVTWQGEPTPAFLVRYHGQIQAFLNRCAHMPVELDWNPGDLFDLSGHYLVCSLHGAHYQADTGICKMGPCVGARLRKIPVVEYEHAIWCLLPAAPEFAPFDLPPKEA